MNITTQTTRTTQNTLRALVAVAAITCGFAATVEADAVEAGQAPQVHIKYADLDLNTTAGATVLYQRIRGAADQVCAAHQERDLGQVMRAKACANRAIAEAVAAVGNTHLTAVYDQKAGAAPVTRLAAR